MMKPDLMRVIACPLCQEELTLHTDELRQDEIISGTLTCSSHLFRIENGIPRFLTGDERQRTQNGFSMQWRLRFEGKFERPDIMYGLRHDKLMEWLFTRCLGDCSRGDWMLDAGCGTAEKSMAAAAQHSDLQVVAMDMADTIEMYAREAERLSNLHYVQGNVMHPPFRPKAFSKVISWGVLHHTHDTHKAFESVANLVAARGRMVVWVYPHPSEDRLAAKYYAVRDKHFFGLGHRLPPRLRLWLLRMYCLALLPYLLYLHKKEVVPKYKDCGYMNVGDLSPLDMYHGTVFLLYDDLMPEYQFRHRREEVLGWFREAGFETVETDNLGHYWGVRA